MCRDRARHRCIRSAQKQARTTLVWRLAALSLSLVAVVATLSLSATAGGQQPPAADAALRDYWSANGLLNRGLYDLAARDYAKFLESHGDHDKAPAARYGYAICLFREKKYDAAVEQLRPLRDRDSFEFATEVGVMLGQAMLALQQPKEAAAEFARAAARAGAHELADDATAGACEALYLAGDAAGAVRQAETLASRWPGSPLLQRASYFAALADIAGKNDASAAKRLDDMLKSDPKGPYADRAALLLAQCRQRGGSADAAVERYREVIATGGDAVLPDALYGLAAILLDQGKPAEARPLLERLAGQFPKSALADATRLNLGRCRIEEGEPAAAMELLNSLAGAEGDYADDAEYWAARALMRQDKHRDAARRLARALKRHPESPLLAEMTYDRAVALTRMGDTAGAIAALAAFDNALSRHALAADALFLRATLQHEAKDHAACLADCKRFSDRFANHALASAMAFLAAESEYLTGEWRPAADLYAAFIKNYPSDERAFDARYRLGLARARQNEPDAAIAALTAALEAKPEHPLACAARLTLGDVQFQRGEWKIAAESLRAALGACGTQPGADDALLKCAVAEQRLKRPRESVAMLERLLREFPESGLADQAAFERGQALLALDQVDEAAAAFEQIVARSAEDRLTAPALEHLARIALRRERHDAAISLLDRWLAAAKDEGSRARAASLRCRALLAAQKFDGVEKAAAGFLRDHADHEDAAVVRAMQAIAWSRLDRFEEALAAIQRIEKEGADRIDDVTRSAVMYEKAYCLGKAGRGDEAAAAYRSTIDASGGTEARPNALLELAEIEARAGRREAAIELLTRIRGMSQKEGVTPELRAAALYRLGVCEFQRGGHGAAADVLGELLQSFPGHALGASAAFYRGEALFQLGQPGKAVNDLRYACEQSRDDELLQPAMLRLGESLAALQQWADCESTYARFLERWPESKQWYQAQFGLGWARENQQRFDEAISAYRPVIERHQGPTAARAQFQIGECLFARNKPEQAARELLKVDILYAYPEWSAAALFEAGRCFEALKRPQDARKQYELLVEKHKDSTWARNAEQRLTQLAQAASELPGR